MWPSEASAVGFAHPDHAKAGQMPLQGSTYVAAGAAKAALISPCLPAPVFAGWYKELLGITAMPWGKAVMAAQAGSPLLQTRVETG